MSVLRRLYYFFEKNVCPARENAIWSQYLKKSASAARTDLAEDYLTLQESCKQYRDLLQSYNIGEKRDTMKEVENVARRVGLSMPEAHKPQPRK